MGSKVSHGPLRTYVLRRAPLRLAMHGRLRDSLVDLVVQEWPLGCPVDRIEEVLRARVSVHLRERYGGVLASLILSVLAGVVIRIIIDWWLSSEENRVLMAEWALAAD